MNDLSAYFAVLFVAAVISLAGGVWFAVLDKDQ